jgi:hypothetical protein
MSVSHPSSTFPFLIFGPCHHVFPNASFSKCKTAFLPNDGVLPTAGTFTKCFEENFLSNGVSLPNSAHKSVSSLYQFMVLTVPHLVKQVGQRGGHVAPRAGNCLHRGGTVTQGLRERDTIFLGCWCAVHRGARSQQAPALAPLSYLFSINPVRVQASSICFIELSCTVRCFDFLAILASICWIVLCIGNFFTRWDYMLFLIQFW